MSVLVGGCCCEDKCLMLSGMLCGKQIIGQRIDRTEHLDDDT